MPLPPARGVRSLGDAFVADLRRAPTHDVVSMGIEILRRLAHRGAAGAIPSSGDGAGILIQIPHAHYERVCRTGASSSPSPATTASRSASSRAIPARAAEMRVARDAVRHHNQKVIGWRDVPVDESVLGPVARELDAGLQAALHRPHVPGGRVRAHPLHDPQARRAASASEAGLSGFYIASLSSKTVVYKGLSLPERLDDFYLDLREEETRSKPRARALALQHEHVPHVGARAPVPAHRAQRRDQHAPRQPDVDARARAAARQRGVRRAPGRLQAHHPPGGSDSASLDNVVDFLVAGGRSLPHVMMMLVPEAWEGQPDMPAERRAFYEYHASPRRAVGRPGGAALHRRPLRRRDARPQRPPPDEVRRHGERLRRRGERARRPRLRAGGRPREGPPPARGKMLLVDIGAGASWATRRSSARSRAEAVRAVARGQQARARVAPGRPSSRRR
jgi:glutamate synthase (NADPH/NADH) large chain